MRKVGSKGKEVGGEELGYLFSPFSDNDRSCLKYTMYMFNEF